MNPELEAKRDLLHRARAAGAPVQPWGRIHVWVELVGDTFDGVEPPRQEQREAYRPGPFQDALIIQALKLDALARGARCRTAHEPGKHRVWLFDSLPTGNEVGAAAHDDEATAWALAWLAAFEDTGE